MRAVDAGAYANLELSRVLRERRLRGRDAAFATELTYGATRLRGRYDPIISLAAGRPLEAIDAPVLDTLRLGSHQLLGMRVPAHAATAETVALARQVHGIGRGRLRQRGAAPGRRTRCGLLAGCGGSAEPAARWSGSRSCTRTRSGW